MGFESDIIETVADRPISNTTYLGGEARSPLYRRIYESLRAAILDGTYRAGERIPSTRALAEELKVSRTVVLLAFQQLRAEGYIAGRVGSGTYVTDELPEEMLSAPRAGVARGAAVASIAVSAYARRVLVSGVFEPPGQGDWGKRLRYDFRHGDPAADDFPTALWRSLVARRAEPVPRYAPPAGDAGLRRAVARYLRRARGIECEPEQVLIVSGSQQALDIGARVLLEAGDRVALEDPHYQGAREVFAAQGQKLVPIPVDEQGIQTRELWRKGRGCRLLFVTPSHQFPTGGILPIGRRHELLLWAKRSEAVIIEDDYDGEYQYAHRPIEPLAALDDSGRVVYVGTFSKVLAPTLRLGYVVLPAPLVEPFVRTKWVNDRGAPLATQQALADFIEEGHFGRHLRRGRIRNAERRRALVSAVERHLGSGARLGGADAGGHSVLWIEGLTAGRARRLAERAASRGVGVLSIERFYLRPPRGPAGLLLCYASLTPPRIRAGIRRLAEALESL